MALSRKTSIDCDEQLLIPDDPKSAVSERVRSVGYMRPRQRDGLPTDGAEGLDDDEAAFHNAMCSEDDLNGQPLTDDLGCGFEDEGEFVDFRMWFFHRRLITLCLFVDQDDDPMSDDQPTLPVFVSDADVSPAISPEIASMHCDTLSRSGLHVDLVHGLVICLECAQAPDPRYIRSHVVAHNLPFPSDEEMEAILRDLDIHDSPSLTSFDEIAPIAGLSVVDGFVCTLDSCGLAVGSKSSLQRHYQDSHMSSLLSYEPCKIHRIFAFKGEQLVVRVDPALAVQRSYGSLADYLSVMCPKDNQLAPVLNPSEDPRKTTGFLFSARWLEVVRGHPLDELLSLVAMPSGVDVLCPVAEGINSMFLDMWNMVDAMEVLPRRHIHTPKG